MAGTGTGMVGHRVVHGLLTKEEAVHALVHSVDHVHVFPLTALSVHADAKC